MQRPVRTVAPVALPVSLDQLKAQCRVDHTDEDELIKSLGQAATEYIEDQYGLALVTQTLQWDTDCFGSTDGIQLTRRPVQSITSVKYYADDATTFTTLDATNYLHTSLGEVYLSASGSWPSIYARRDAVRITYIAGFGEPYDVPMKIRQAVRLLVGHWYQSREAATERPPAQIAMGVDALLNPHREYHV